MAGAGKGEKIVTFSEQVLCAGTEQSTLSSSPHNPALAHSMNI